MQIGQTQVVRSNWYDRSLAILSFLRTTSPVVAGFTVRETYTVPVNRTALISITPTVVRRGIVASVAGLYATYYGLTPNGGAVDYFGKAESKGNVIEDGFVNPINTTMRMFAGDKLDWITSDGSTGGSITFTGGFVVNEYDA